MAYEWQSFKNGQVLEAKHLNRIESSVIQHDVFAAETMRHLCKLATFPLYVVDANLAILGDSTTTGYPSYARLSTYFSVKSGKKISDIAKAGDTILGQLNLWNGLSAAEKSALNYVFVQIGLNDIDQLTETLEDFRTNYKRLVAQIRADAPNAMLILGTMIPCKGRWKSLQGDQWQNAQTKWEAVNEDIKSGYYDCDRVAYLHTIALGLDDNLRAEYDHGDHIHENAEGGKIVAYSWHATAFGNV